MRSRFHTRKIPILILLGILYGVLTNEQTLTYVRPHGAFTDGEGGLHIRAIPRIKLADNVTYEEFFRMTEHKPIIVEGAVKHHPAFHLQFEDLKALCGVQNIRTFVQKKNDPTFAGLRQSQADETLEAFIDDMFLSDKPRGNLRYAAFLQLPEVCMALENLISVNKYVAFAITQAVNPFEDWFLEQPEIFLGPKGTRSEIHIDKPNYPFWMNVYIGSKTFRTIDFHEAFQHWGQELRYPRFMRKVKGWFGFTQERALDIWDPDLKVFPELADMTVYEGTVNAGDFIYLPPAMMHAVYNKENSFGLSENALPLPHIDLWMASCLKRGLYVPRFFDHAGCIREENFTEAHQANLQQHYKSCKDSGPAVLQRKRELASMPFEDRSMHDIYGLKSSDEFCAYHHINKAIRPTKIIIRNGKQMLEPQSNPKGEWLKHRKEYQNIPECEYARRQAALFRSSHL